jgi:hypothetical protein
MRLKAKAITLVALIVLTATPRVFDRVAALKNRASERFRAELLNVFWNLTTPETENVDAARRYSELLARAEESGTQRCDGSDEQMRTARAAGATNRLTRSQAPADELEHPPQPFAFDGPTPADVAMARSDKPLEPLDGASLSGREDIVLVARNFKDYPAFDEFAVPVVVDDAIARFELSQTDETVPLPEARPAAPPQRAFPNARRFTQKFVHTSFQVQLPENLDGMLSNVITNTDALIKARDAATAPKPKCRVRVLRLAPEAPPPPLEKPALIS